MDEEEIEKLVDKKIEEKLEQKKEDKRQKTRKKADKTISRRKFAKLLGIGGGGLLLTSLTDKVVGETVLEPDYIDAPEFLEDGKDTLSNDITGTAGNAEEIEGEPRPKAGYLLSEDSDSNFNVQETEINHENLINNSKMDAHHTRFSNSSSDSLSDIPTRPHSQLTNISNNDHHNRPGAGTLISEDSNHNFNVQESNINHENLINNSKMDAHHTRFSNSSSDSLSDIPTRPHSQLTNISNNDHHSRYSDSEAINAINNDGDHGSTAQHNYFTGNHDHLSNISSNDHHSKTGNDEVFGLVRAQSSAPSYPTTGQIYFDTGDDTLKVYNGSNWVAVGAVYK